MRLTPQEADWLYALQRPWPLVERPLAALADTLGASEADLLRFIAGLRAQGLVRRIGAVFDARRLGYRSCLFALPPQPPAEEEAAAHRLAALPGVTHAYIRGWPEGLTLDGISAADYAGLPRLWFTLSARGDRFEAETARLADLRALGLAPLLPDRRDICTATQERQDAVRALASQADRFIVLGSRTSSNSKRLAEVAQSAGCPATLIASPDELDGLDLSGVRTLALTSGASTPESLLDALRARLESPRAPHP